MRKGQIFVFGSNLAGVHGAGAAADALKWYGAKIGIGEGLQGSSYGIPTKGQNIETLALGEIQKHVKTFIEFAKNNPQLQFFVTRIGCGLAGYKDYQIGPLFKDAPENCELPKEWLEWRTQYG
jgi:hypothetical protein